MRIRKMIDLIRNVEWWTGRGVQKMRLCLALCLGKVMSSDILWSTAKVGSLFSKPNP
jgi:hypothetical protein